MAEKKKKRFSLWDKLSPAMRMVVFIGGAVLIIILIIVGICLLQLRDDEKKPSQTGNGLNKDFSLLIGERNENESLSEEYVYSDMSTEQIFALYEGNDSYYHECTVTVFGADGSKFERVKRILRDGDKYNIRTYNKNTLIETIKCDGENTVIINETTGNRNILPLSDIALPMELASMPSHVYLLSLLKEYETDKENASLESAVFNLSRSRDMNILEVEIKYKDTGMVEKYEYYLNYGIIYSCESSSQDGKMDAYSMNTIYFDRNISSYILPSTFDVN